MNDGPAESIYGKLWADSAECPITKGYTIIPEFIIFYY